MTIRNVTVSHIGDGIQIANRRSDSGGVPLAGLRYSIHEVIVDDLNAAVDALRLAIAGIK